MFEKIKNLFRWKKPKAPKIQYCENQLKPKNATANYATSSVVGGVANRPRPRPAVGSMLVGSKPGNGVSNSKGTAPNDDDGNFVSSAVIGYAANNALIGGILGGSLAGGLVGDLANDSDSSFDTDIGSSSDSGYGGSYDSGYGGSYDSGSSGSYDSGSSGSSSD